MNKAAMVASRNDMRAKTGSDEQVHHAGVWGKSQSKGPAVSGDVACPRSSKEARVTGMKQTRERQGR